MKKNSKRKKILIIATGLILIIAIVIAARVHKFNEYIESIVITDVDLTQVQDGTYTGMTDSGVVKVEVEVTVSDHMIIDIQIIEHVNGKGEPAEAIVDDMIEQQKVTVDSVSGATYSSLVIKDAVQKALKSGL